MVPLRPTPKWRAMVGRVMLTIDESSVDMKMPMAMTKKAAHLLGRSVDLVSAAAGATGEVDVSELMWPFVELLSPLGTAVSSGRTLVSSLFLPGRAGSER